MVLEWGMVRLWQSVSAPLWESLRLLAMLPVWWMILAWEMVPV